MLAQIVVIHESASILGPLLIAGGATFAAVLTVLTANWRHRKQLEHDRDERNRDHTRDSLDTAVSGATNAIETVSSYATESEHFAKWTARLRRAYEIEAEENDDNEEDEFGDEPERRHPDHAEREAELIKALERAWSATQTMRHDNVRLELRLGEHHPIVRHHAEMRESLENWRHLCGVQNKDGGKQKEITVQIEQVTESFSKFRKACNAWFALDPGQ